MNNYLFSDDQLAMLSSLMNGNIIYGIESKLFNHWQYINKQKIQDIYNSLQNSNWISIDYEGKIRIEKQLYEMLNVLIAPNELLCLTKSYFNGKKEIYYYYKKDHYLLELKRQNQFHLLSFVSEIPIEKAESIDIDETFTNTDLESVNGYLEWFDEDGAMNYLRNISNKPKYILDILNKNYDEFKVDYYVWNQQKIVRNTNLIVGLMNNLMFEWIEDNATVHIQGGCRHFDSIIHSILTGVIK